MDRPFKGGANPPQEEFKYLSFGYTEAVSIQPNTPPYANLADALQIRIRKFAQYAAAITIFLGSPGFTVSVSMIFHVVRTAFDRTLSRFEILGLVALIHMTFALAFKCWIDSCHS